MAVRWARMVSSGSRSLGDSSGRRYVSNLVTLEVLDSDLEQIYDCPDRYLGMLGSKPRIAKIWQHLEAKGMARQWLDRVHAPIGLNIYARSPEEIAISNLAEIIHVRRTSPVVIPQWQTQRF